MRLTRFLRSRFIRAETWGERSIRLAQGILFMVWGLLGLLAAPRLSHRPVWLNYFLPAVILVVGCTLLYVAWRRWLFVKE